MTYSKLFVELTETEALYYDGGANFWLIAGGAVMLIGGVATANACGVAGGVVTIIAGIVY